MEKQRPITYADVRRQVARMQKLYSAIGEPLAVDVIFELCHHLPTVLQGGKERKKGRKKPR